MCGAVGAALLFRTKFEERNYSLARCRKCGLHFCHPPPSDADIIGFYRGDYHEELRIAGATERVFGAKFTSYRDWIVQFLQGGRSLDIGTATGLMPSLLKQTGFDAEGIEYNPASAKWAEEHYGIRILTGDIRQYGLELGTFDLILMTDVLEHMQHPLEFLQTVGSYLKPGGFMLITFPDILSAESRFARLWSRLLRRDWIWYCCRIPLHIWEFTPATARAMFDKAGLDVVGFRRRHEHQDAYSGMLKVLSLPLLLLRIPMVGNALGSQMQFVLRKRA
jgi:2-polyprenyl-3-methyl-5-hydroxy-6-metoxy-1,4-benzoquinol methylase